MEAACSSENSVSLTRLHGVIPQETAMRVTTAEETSEFVYDYDFGNIHGIWRLILKCMLWK
jgi:hypothetical protein